MPRAFVKDALPWLVALAVLLPLPFVFSSGGAVTIMNQMAITIVFALSYNMLLGQAGILSFGHAVFMGMGGFFSIHVINWLSETGLPVPLPFLPLFGGVFGLGTAMIIGAFSLRRSGVVFAMISLGVVELVSAYAIVTYGFFSGGGVGADRTFVAPFFGITFPQQSEVYYIVTVWMMLSAFLMYLFTRTPAGRMANAVRDNPERAEYLGYSAYWVRFCSFCGAGYFAGVAGALFAITYEITTVENMSLQASGTILMITFLGGIGVFWGPVVGAVVFTILQTVLSMQTELWQLYTGALFVASVMFFPGGLAGVMVAHVPVLHSGGARRLIRPYLLTLLPAAVCILSVVGLCEMLHAARNASVGEHVITLLWVPTDIHNPLVWGALVVAALGGFRGARRQAKALAAEWHQVIVNAA